MIAVSGGTLYWVNSNPPNEGNLMKMPIAGGAPVKLATGPFHELAVDADNVYLIDASKVMKVPVQGGALTTLASDGTSPTSLAIDPANVYWTVNTIDSCPPDGDICPDGVVRKVPIGGGTPTTLASGQALPDGIAVDEQNVYWINRGIMVASTTVMKMPVAGGTPTALASGLAGVTGRIAVGGGDVYWTGLSGLATTPTLTKVPIVGGTATFVATGSGVGADIAVVAGNVYWLEYSFSGANVKAVSLGGGAPAVVGSIGTSASSIGGIAVDPANLYWTERWADGSVWSLGANTCENSECRCPANQSVCFGACIDLQADAMNCGACGARCPQGMMCRSGGCTAM
jgi:hypothetical protein